jgi:G8 domain
MRQLAVPFAAVILLACITGPAVASAPVRVQEKPLLRSNRSGLWSSKDTWDAGRVPKTGDRVVIREGHHVSYDVDSKEVIRLVQVAGTLEFARDRDTRLEVGLITIAANENPSEGGFDCHSQPRAMPEGKARPALLVGTPGQPIPVRHTAVIRLHHVEGMNRESCPAIVCCGGRMEFHGAPLARTWVKIKRPAEAGASAVFVAERVEGWQNGDRVIVTSTRRQRDRRGGGGGSFFDNAQTEERKVVSVGTREAFEGGFPVRLDKPLTFSHCGDGRPR